MAASRYAWHWCERADANATCLGKSRGYLCNHFATTLLHAMAPDTYHDTCL